MFTRFEIGETVKLARSQRGMLGDLGYPKARRGERGVIVGRAGGWSDRYDVRIGGATTLRVPGRDLRPCHTGSFGTDVIIGIKLALLLIMVRGLYPAVIYLIKGGSPAVLIAQLPIQFADQVLSIASLVSLPWLLAGVAVILLIRRHRRQPS